MLVGLAMACGTVLMIEPAPTDIAITLLFATGLVLNRLRFTAAQSVPILLLSAFLLANILSMEDPIDVSRAIWYVAITIYLILSMVFFAGLVTKFGFQALKPIAAGYIFGGILSVALGVSAFLRLIPWGDILLLYGRPKGLFKDPNVFGPYLVPMAICALAGLQYSSNSTLTRRLGWAALFLISTIGIFLSYSRASWVNYGVAIVTFSVILAVSAGSYALFMARVTRAALFAVVAGIAIFCVANIPQVSQMLTVRVGARGLQSYDQTRFYIHDLAIKTARERPLGIGPGQSETYFQYATHSTYLRVLVENGVLGAAAFLAVVVLSLLRSFSIAFRARSATERMVGAILAASLAGIIANSVVIDSVHWRHLWLLMALAWAFDPTSQPTTRSAHA
jgi:O-antigen ligase